MLEFMRKSANTIFIKAFLLLLVLSFAVWGIGDIFRGRASEVAVATVGDIPIPVERYRAELTRDAQRMSQLFKREFTPQEAQAMGLGQALVQRMVQETLVTLGAQDLGLYISNAQILDAVRKAPEFKNQSGQFDRNVFMSKLAQAGFSEDRYFNQVRGNMERRQLLAPVESGATPPKGLIDALYVHTYETRTADVIRIEHNTLTNVPQPTDADLVKFHEDNASRFMAPEYRQLAAVILKTADIANTITLTEDDIQAAYDEREAEYLTPEKRKLRQILVNDEAAATQAKALLDAGKSLDDAAAEVGANKAMMDIGQFTSSDAANLSPEISTAVFAVAKGGYTAPLKSPLGWHVIEVADIVPQVVKPLADVRDELAAALKEDQSLNLLYEQSNQLDDLLGGGQTFEEAANALGLQAATVANVDAQGLTPAGTPAQMPYLADVLKQAFSLGEGQDSTMTETDDGKAFFVVRVDGVTAPALRPLDTVKNDVAAAWEAGARADLAAELAKTVTERLKAGGTATDVAQSFGLTASTTTPFNRNGDGLLSGTIPAAMIVDLFSINQGEVTSAPGTGAHTVARVGSVTKAQVNQKDQTYLALQDKVLGDMQTDLLSQFTQALQGKYGVQVHPNVINEAF
ncbi:SurA N-terminal domain-containing protein [Magnetovibrio sp. PR-2]|uniref:SurA N-terminal domain-containing protein n=1 Tax=Magnetovibrio sp. PR-2 TaxID=3120356 RepID=UPI002FCE558F